MINLLKRPLDGYAFPVYTTESCPKTETEWRQRFSAINCTDSKGYMCTPNENITELIEFCYVLPSVLITKGNILFFHDKN